MWEGAAAHWLVATIIVTVHGLKERLLDTKKKKKEKAEPQGRSKGREQRRPRLQKEREERVKGTEDSPPHFPLCS